MNVCNPLDIAVFAKEILKLDILAEEYSYALGLDTKNKILGLFCISHGTVDTSFMTPREIFIRLLLCGAVSYVVIHNHPSGDTSPSTSDDLITRRISEASDLMGIKLLDHIIIGDNYYSYKENNKI